MIEDASADSLHPFVQDSIKPGSTVHTDGWQGYAGLERKGYHREITVLRGRRKEASKLMPRVHRVASLLKRLECPCRERLGCMTCASSSAAAQSTMIGPVACKTVNERVSADNRLPGLQKTYDPLVNSAPQRGADHLWRKDPPM
jgi:hypothetical protein